MNVPPILRKAIELVAKRQYRLSIHAENEREKDSLTLKEIEECFLNGKMELLEDYPEDNRGHSFLMLGFTDGGRTVHYVGAIHEKELVLITLYRPNPQKWINLRMRVKSK